MSSSTRRESREVPGAQPPYASPGSPIIQYWHEDKPPADVSRLVATFKEKNPTITHMLFSEEEAAAFIAEHFGPRETAAFSACAVPAMQADYFRYCALGAVGGTWIDTDLCCRRSLATLIGPDDEGLAPTPREVDFPTRNDFLFVRPDHPLPRLLRDVATANIERRVNDRLPFVTGPWLIAALGVVYTSGSFSASKQGIVDARQLRLLDTIEQTVGAYQRIADAFSRVRLISGAQLADWVHSEWSVAYKLSDTHWGNWQKTTRSIYR